MVWRLQPIGETRWVPEPKRRRGPLPRCQSMTIQIIWPRERELPCAWFWRKTPMAQLPTPICQLQSAAFRSFPDGPAVNSFRDAQADVAPQVKSSRNDWRLAARNATVLYAMHSFALAVGDVRGSSSPAAIFISDQPPGCRDFLEDKTFNTVRIKRAANHARLRLLAGESPEGRSRQEHEQDIGKMVRGGSSLCTG